MDSPSDIVEFLRARLNEDEQAAHAASPGPWKDPDELDESEILLFTREDAYHIYRHAPAQVLREVEAKRSVVDAYVKWSAVPQAKIANYNDGFAAGLLSAVEALASAYSDHPDYRLGWRL